jgi:hypothetical protein
VSPCPRLDPGRVGRRQEVLPVMQSLTARRGIALGDHPAPAGSRERNLHETTFIPPIVQRASRRGQEGKANVKATVAGTPAGRGEGDAHIHSPKKPLAAGGPAARIPNEDGAGGRRLGRGIRGDFLSPSPPQRRLSPREVRERVVLAGVHDPVRRLAQKGRATRRLRCRRFARQSAEMASSPAEPRANRRGGPSRTIRPPRPKAPDLGQGRARRRH